MPGSSGFQSIISNTDLDWGIDSLEGFASDGVGEDIISVGEIVILSVGSLSDNDVGVSDLSTEVGISWILQGEVEFLSKIMVAVGIFNFLWSDLQLEVDISLSSISWVSEVDEVPLIDLLVVSDILNKVGVASSASNSHGVWVGGEVIVVLTVGEDGKSSISTSGVVLILWFIIGGESEQHVPVGDIISFPLEPSSDWVLNGECDISSSNLDIGLVSLARLAHSGFSDLLEDGLLINRNLRSRHLSELLSELIDVVDEGSLAKLKSDVLDHSVESRVWELLSS